MYRREPQLNSTYLCVITIIVRLPLNNSMKIDIPILGHGRMRDVTECVFFSACVESQSRCCSSDLHGAGRGTATTITDTRCRSCYSLFVRPHICYLRVLRLLVLACW